MEVKKNKVVAFLATGAMLCSMVAIPTAQGQDILTTTGIVQTVDADATTFFNNLSTSCSRQYCTVKLNNSRKVAYVYMQNNDRMYSRNNYHYIKVTTSTGRVVKTAKCGSNAFAKISLPKGNSTYRIYVYSAHNGGNCNFIANSNCTVR